MKTCPVCRKTGFTKKQLASHVASVHAGKGPNKPKQPPPRVQLVPDRRRKGKGLVLPIGLKSGMAAGAVLLFRAVNPHTLSDSRLALETTLWSQWRLHSFSIHVTGGFSVMATGTLLLGWTPSHALTTGSAEQVVQWVSSLRPSVAGSVGQRLSLTVPGKSPWLDIVGNDPSRTDFGRILLVVGTPLAGFDGEIGALLNVKYDIEFAGPVTPVEVGKRGIYAAQGGYFTTSLGGWAGGKKLTIKNHSGGSPVDFPSIQKGVVYKIDSGANLTYKDAAGANQKILYMTSMRNPSYPLAAAVFASFERAEKFAGGEDSAALDYSSAGDWVEPDNPVWTPTTSAVAEEEYVSQDVEDLQRVISGLTARLSQFESRLDRLTAAAVVPSSSRRHPAGEDAEVVPHPRHLPPDVVDEHLLRSPRDDLQGSHSESDS